MHTRAPAAPPLPRHANPAPRPADVKQSIWHNTCYILAPLQAIAASHPAHLAGMLTPTDRGMLVRHHGESRSTYYEPKVGPRFLPEAPAITGHTLVSQTATLRSWPKMLQQAYLDTAGSGVSCLSHPDKVFYWALGCRVHTAALPRGTERADVLAELARLFKAGECVAFYVGRHCWSMIGACEERTPAGIRWRLTLADPRGWKRSFTAYHDREARLSSVYGYAVTLGAASSVQRTADIVAQSLLDKGRAKA